MFGHLFVVDPGRHRIGTSRSDLKACIGTLDMIMYGLGVPHAFNARIEGRHDSTIGEDKFMPESVNEWGYTAYAVAP